MPKATITSILTPRHTPRREVGSSSRAQKSKYSDKGKGKPLWIRIKTSESLLACFVGSERSGVTDRTRAPTASRLRCNAASSRQFEASAKRSQRRSQRQSMKDYTPNCIDMSACLRSTARSLTRLSNKTLQTAMPHRSLSSKHLGRPCRWVRGRRPRLRIWCNPPDIVRTNHPAILIGEFPLPKLSRFKSTS